MNSPVSRSAFSTLIAVLNIPHIRLLCEHAGTDPEPYLKLCSKVLSFLRGELRSEANLLRFHDAFCDWRQQLAEDDSLNGRIADLSCSALYSAVESLFDPECDDTGLLLGGINELYDELADLGGDADGLRRYWQSLQQEFHEQIADNARRPLPQAFFRWLAETDTSLFGLAE